MYRVPVPVSGDRPEDSWVYSVSKLFLLSQEETSSGTLKRGFFSFTKTTFTLYSPTIFFTLETSDVLTPNVGSKQYASNSFNGFEGIDVKGGVAA